MPTKTQAAHNLKLWWLWEVVHPVVHLRALKHIWGIFTQYGLVIVFPSLV